MKIRAMMTASVLALCLCAPVAMAGAFEKTATGIIVTPDGGAARQVRLDVMTPSIIHVLAVDDPNRAQMPSLMTVAVPQPGHFTVTLSPGKGRHGHKTVTLDAGQAKAQVDLATGLVTFFNARGQQVLNQTEADIKPVSIEGKPYVATLARFNPGTHEAFYGLGQHQNAQMNLNGEDILLSQHNMDVAIPFVVSDSNYGLLWDNNSISRWGNPTPYALMSRDLKLTSEDGKPGLTAKYYVDGKLVLTRIESDIRYQYQKDVAENWPKEVPDRGDVKVVWDGTLSSDLPGVHKMQLYSSDYATLTLDGKPVMNVWRQNWNPWYHNFEASFARGKPVKFHLEWKPSGGMIAVTHDNPQPAALQHSLTLSSEAGTGLNYYFIAASDMDGVIGGYRTLTGQAPLMPKWAYGFWQSRQRYETQDQLLGVVAEYRKRGWPLDNIV
ncbi:MAG: TIM-barrel domain-containing protein, partial [Asticcacaulis sp.]